MEIKHNKYDSVFTTLFKDKKYLCQLFKALDGDDIIESDIENITLNCVLADGIYNDLGFTAKGKMLILLEAQSTWSLNIVTRLFFYTAETYKRLLNNKTLYTTKLVALPEPQFYVIYTGDGIVPANISFNDIFGKETALNMKVNVLTNGKENDIIAQYISFTKVLKSQIAIHGQSITAMKETIKICTNKNILKDFLSAHEQEVACLWQARNHGGLSF